MSCGGQAHLEIESLLKVGRWQRITLPEAVLVIALCKLQFKANSRGSGAWKKRMLAPLLLADSLVCIRLRIEGHSLEWGCACHG